MKRVYKYPLSICDSCTVRLPIGAQTLTAQMQGGSLQLWALVDPDTATELRRFRIHGTGHNVFEPETLRYISTFQLLNGSLIFHVFEEID